MTVERNGMWEELKHELLKAQNRIEAIGW